MTKMDTTIFSATSTNQPSFSITLSNLFPFWTNTRSYTRIKKKEDFNHSIKFQSIKSYNSYNAIMNFWIFVCDRSFSSGPSRSPMLSWYSWTIQEILLLKPLIFLLKKYWVSSSDTLSDSIQAKKVGIQSMVSKR